MYAVKSSRRIKKKTTNMGREVKADPLDPSNILLTFSPAEDPGYEKGGAHSYAIKCRLPCQATDGSPAAYWKDISFGRVPPIQLIHANFPRGCGNLSVALPLHPLDWFCGRSVGYISLMLGRKFATSRNSRSRYFSLEWFCRKWKRHGTWKSRIYDASYDDVLRNENLFLERLFLYATERDL